MHFGFLLQGTSVVLGVSCAELEPDEGVYGTCAVLLD